MGAGRDHAPVPQHGVPRALHARMGLCPLLSGLGTLVACKGQGPRLACCLGCALYSRTKLKLTETLPTS